MNQNNFNFEFNPRREFLKKLGLLGMAASLPPVLWQCSTKNTGYHGTGIPPYRVWEEMLMALQTSPDHLEGRMNQLIQEGNPKAMFDFVRDEIHLMPTSVGSLRGLGKTMRYGIRGALRYGFATPREKAELLHHMLSKANISSSVVYERTAIQPDDVPSFFYRPVERKFEPAIDKKTLDRWSNEMGAGESESGVVNPDPGLAESKKLAENLWSLIPEKEKLRAQKFDFRWDNYRTPTVEFQHEGETKYAHLFDPDIPFGSLRNAENGQTSPAEEAEFTNEKVAISLSYRTGIKPQEEKELVQGEWFVHELAGNQVVCSFLHGLDLERQISTPVRNLRIFTPALSFQSFDADRPFLEARSFLGNPVTLEGKTIDMSSDKAVFENSSLLAKPNETLQKEIERLEVKAIPGSYPLVKLQVSPLNASGEMISGLSASDFAIADNETPVQAIMESNQRTPKVLILYDTSLSMPKTYFGENMDAFVASLESAILEKFPDTQITKWETSSDLYTWLTKASHTSNDLIIFATDGDNSDEYDAAKMEKLKSGPPALILNVKNSTSRNHQESFGNMANATNGMVFDARDQAGTIENITRYVSELEIPPYVFTYYASGEKIPHQITITADNHRVKANDSFNFTLIPDDNSEAGEHIIGLYLNVKTGNQNVRRVLAGWDNVVDRDRKPDFKDFTDVQNMLLGSILIAVEGEGPTLSASLCDILKYRLTTRKWGEAVIQKDFETAAKAYAEGSFAYDENLASLMTPLQDAVTSGSFTFAGGTRIGVIKAWPGINREFSTYSFDYLPTSNYVSLTADPVEGFKKTLEKTAQLAILENHLFDNSTLSALTSKSIVSSQEAGNTEWFKQLYREGPDARFWYETIYRSDGSYKLFDRSGSEKAFWRIDAQTGELYGLLSDMTGGGTNHIQAQLDELSRVMNAYSLIFAAVGYGTVPIGIVTVYGMLLVRLYAIVCEALIVMDTTGMDEKIAEAMQQFACNVMKVILLSTFGAQGGNALSGLDNLIGLMGGGGIPGMQC